MVGFAPRLGHAPDTTPYDEPLLLAYDALDDCARIRVRIEVLLRYPDEIDRALVDAEIQALRSTLLRAHQALAQGGA